MSKKIKSREKYKTTHTTHGTGQYRRSDNGRSQTPTTTPAYLPMQFLCFRTTSARVPLGYKILGWRLELTVRPFNL